MLSFDLVERNIRDEYVVVSGVNHFKLIRALPSAPFMKSMMRVEKEDIIRLFI